MRKGSYSYFILSRKFLHVLIYECTWVVEGEGEREKSGMKDVRKIFSAFDMLLKLP